MTFPIGVFDSGLGGLSVARRILSKLPQESIIYFADSAHVPYGERPLAEIQGFALRIISFLIGNGAKAIVVACNMSSAVALDAAGARFPGVPILGVIEPGARAAVEACDGAPIGVLATTGTIRSAAYVRAIGRLDPSVQVIGQACPKFVPLIESGKASSEEAEAAASTYVEPLISRGCKTVVLGCTHYPFVRAAIEAAAGDGVTLVDPAEETVRALHKTLTERNALNKQPGGPHEFCASGDTAGLASLGSEFLGTRIESVQHVDWERLNGFRARSTEREARLRSER